MDDQFIFIDEPRSVAPDASVDDVWKVLIVDDEPDMHAITKISLSNYEFLGRPLELHHCYSGTEAKAFLKNHDDIAVILLDVVMETDDAGLSVVEYVRKNLQNKRVRIVLRTANPGQAPEHRVITGYDINDYKEKAELTAQKLFTLMYSALRSYRDIIAIERSKRGLEAVITASVDVLERRSVDQFAQGVLQQLTALLHTSNGAALLGQSGLSAMLEGDGSLRIHAATGAFSEHTGDLAADCLPAAVLADLCVAMENTGFHRLEDRIIVSFRSSQGAVHILYLTGVSTVSGIDSRLLELFARNVSIAFENLRMYETTQASQRDVVNLLEDKPEPEPKTDTEPESAESDIPIHSDNVIRLDLVART